MKSISASLVAAALFVAILPAQAQQRPYPEGQAPAPKAVTDPLQVIYRISGVRDSGTGTHAGMATSFHCTSFSTVDEKIVFALRDFDGDVITQKSVTVEPQHTITASTHDTRVFTEDRLLSPGVVINQGSVRISATSTNIICSAMIVDASAAFPEGIALHLVRFNPIAGTQE
jgi:hypothetical protein